MLHGKMAGCSLMARSSHCITGRTGMLWHTLIAKAIILSISRSANSICLCFSTLKCWQVVSMPNLQIVDFGFGFTGSTHDATAWLETGLAKEHKTILEPGKFVWGDSTYLARS